jgi:hypothetical protein
MVTCYARSWRFSARATAEISESSGPWSQLHGRMSSTRNAQLAEQYRVDDDRVTYVYMVREHAAKRLSFTIQAHV